MARAEVSFGRSDAWFPRAGVLLSILRPFSLANSVELLLFAAVLFLFLLVRSLSPVDMIYLSHLTSLCETAETSYQVGG